MDLISETHQNGYKQTVLKVKNYNNSAYKNMSQVNKTIRGEWEHIKSSESSLSCSIIYEKVQNKIGLVRYQSAKRKIELMGSFDLTSVTRQQNLTKQDLRMMFHVGEYCSVLKVKSLNLTTFYRANANWTALVVVVLPATWDLGAESKDLSYLISNGNLYRYDPQDHLYKVAYRFNARYLRYKLENVGDRVILSCARSNVAVTHISPPINNTNYSIWVFSWSRTLQRMEVVDNFQVRDVKETRDNLMDMLVSPFLSKVGFAYETGRGLYNVTIKHIDYARKQAVTVDVERPIEFVMGVRGIDTKKELDFSDNFVAFRNTSKYNESRPYRKAVEMTYQISGTNLKILRARPLNISNNTNVSDAKEYGRHVKMWIDDSVRDKLFIVNVYKNQNGSGYSV